MAVHKSSWEPSAEHLWSHRARVPLPVSAAVMGPVSWRATREMQDGERDASGFGREKDKKKKSTVRAREDATKRKRCVDE